MIRLPSGPPTTGAAATGGSNTPTTNTAPSPVTTLVGSQSMQTVPSMTPSTNVGAQPFTGSSVGNSGGNVGAPSQGPQQQGTSTIHGSSKNGLSRTAPSPGQGPTTSNSIQQASTGNHLKNSVIKTFRIGKLLIR